MPGDQSRSDSQEEGKSSPFDIWGKTGLTEHLGGINATRRLLGKCSLNEGMKVLNVGCGTGYTACFIAKNFGTRVIALDINQRNIAEAGKRAFKQSAEDQVLLVQADAHSLPFISAVFDAIIIESVLVFCDAFEVLTKIHHIMKPGSVLGINELTLLKLPPKRLVSLLADILGMQSFQKEGWETVIRKAGFTDVISTVHKINFWDQLASHLQVDGLKKYFAGFAISISDRSIRRMFFKKELLTAVFDFLPYVGYGIYTGKKL